MSNSPIPFPGAANVPILNQPITFLGWFPTVMTVCNCEPERPHPMLIVGFGVAAVCPKCRHGYKLNGVVQADARTGAPHFAVEVLMPSLGDEPPASSGLIQ